MSFVARASGQLSGGMRCCSTALSRLLEFCYPHRDYSNRAAQPYPGGNIRTDRRRTRMNFHGDRDTPIASELGRRVHGSSAFRDFPGGTSPQSFIATRSFASSILSCAAGKLRSARCTARRASISSSAGLCVGVLLRPRRDAPTRHVFHGSPRATKHHTRQ